MIEDRKTKIIASDCAFLCAGILCHFMSVRNIFYAVSVLTYYVNLVHHFYVFVWFLIGLDVYQLL